MAKESFMLLSPELLTARAKDVSLDSASLFWAGEPDAGLFSSLTSLGQLSPVIAATGENRPLCLAGSRRVKALIALKLPVRVQVLAPDWKDAPVLAGLPEAAAFGMIYLASNHGAQLTGAKLLAAGRYFARCIDHPRFVDTCAPLLGLSPKDKALAWLAAWLTLPGDFDALIAGENLPLAAAPALAALPEEDARTLMPYLGAARWTRGAVLPFLTCLRETALGRGKTMKHVVEDAGLPAILERDLSPNDRLAALSRAARAARYPRLTGLEDRFARAAKDLAKGSKWRLAPSQGFEEDGAELKVTVKSVTDVRQAAKALAERAGHEAWREIFGLIDNQSRESQSQ